MKTLLIIPAAGKNTRFKANYPKVLAKIGNKTVLEKIIFVTKKLKNIDTIFILNSKNKKIIYEYIINNIPNYKFDFVIQKKQLGTLNAIICCKSYFNFYSNILIIWGDQVGINIKNLEFLSKFNQKLDKEIFIPLIKVSNPYVEYILEKNKIKKILETREGAKVNSHGYSDIGIFSIPSKNFYKFYINFMKLNNFGKKTKEFSFLQFLIFIQDFYKINFVKAKEKKSTYGVNTIEDINKFLKL